MKPPARPPHYRRPQYSWIAIVSLLLVAVAGITLVLAPYGYRQGWWGFGLALKQLIPLATLTALIGLLLSLIGLGHSWPGTRRNGFVSALTALVISCALLWQPLSAMLKFKTLPAIHDISTDLQNPPQFLASVAERRAQGLNSADYAGAELAAQQSCGYPELSGFSSSRNVSEVFAIAQTIALSEGWVIVAENPDKGTFEATITSSWFGFVDDAIVRITAVGQGSRVDVRSASRVGISDLGANAQRIESFLTKLKSALK